MNVLGKRKQNARLRSTLKGVGTEGAAQGLGVSGGCELDSIRGERISTHDPYADALHLLHTVFISPPKDYAIPFAAQQLGAGYPSSTFNDLSDKAIETSSRRHCCDNLLPLAFSLAIR